MDVHLHSDSRPTNPIRLDSNSICRRKRGKCDEPTSRISIRSLFSVPVFYATERSLSWKGQEVEESTTTTKNYLKFSKRNVGHRSDRSDDATTNANNWPTACDVCRTRTDRTPILKTRKIIVEHRISLAKIPVKPNTKSWKPEKPRKNERKKHEQEWISYIIYVGTIYLNVSTKVRHPEYKLVLIKRYCNCCFFRKCTHNTVFLLWFGCALFLFLPFFSLFLFIFFVILRPFCLHIFAPPVDFRTFNWCTKSQSKQAKSTERSEQNGKTREAKWKTKRRKKNPKRMDCEECEKGKTWSHGVALNACRMIIKYKIIQK